MHIHRTRPQEKVAAIGPLIDLLQREIDLVGIASPGPAPRSVREFTLWYLEVVQLLDSHCAAVDEHPAMLRSEVEMMCRAALSARTLREAIALCARFAVMLAPRAGKLTLEENGPIASFRLDTLRQGMTPASSLVDITGLFAYRQLFEWLVGLDMKLLQVNIGPVEREDVLPFLKLFHAPVLSGGRCYAMDFPAESLDLPVVRTSAEFEPFFDVFPCAVFADTRHGLAAQVASLIAASLRQNAGTPTQESLAAAFGLPLSTFRRRLVDSGASFRQIREECLQERAQHCLRQSEYSVKEIAGMLGFSDAGAFRRAFKQWTGASPTQWQRVHSATPV